MHPGVGFDRVIRGDQRYPAAGAIGAFDMKDQIELPSAVPLQGQIVWIAAVSGVTPEKYLLESGDPDVVGMMWDRIDPAFDGERVGEVKVGRITQLDFGSKSIPGGIGRRPRNAWEPERFGSVPVVDVSGGCRGGGIDECTMIAANNIAGTPAQRVNRAIPPTDSTGATQVVA